MAALQKPTMTYAEYLELERTSDEKHEYLRGDVWAMAGGTPTHSRIATNIAVALSNALKGRPCAVFNSDLCVRVEETDRTTYPDVTVVWGKRVAASDDPNAIVNPVVIVEVLSVATEASDRGEKFAHLQRLSSLKEYVLVSQRERRIEVFRRGETMWSYQPSVEGEVELSSVNVKLNFEDVYADPTAP